MATLGLKNVNMLTKEQYDTIAEPVQDELYAISGSGFGFPSSNYEDLTLGASDSYYTAPANGWFVLAKNSSGAGQEIRITNEQNGIIGYATSHQNQAISATAECLKGQRVKVFYSVAGSTHWFRFIYAEGE
jgi:hypothetical protein